MTEEDTLGLRCTETDDGQLRCDYDFVDEGGEIHMEMTCEEDEGERRCEVDLSITGDHAEDLFDERTGGEAFDHPENEKEFHTRKLDQDYHEKQRRRRQFEQDILVDE